MTPTETIREAYFQVNQEGLARLAWRALHVHKQKPTDFFVICVEVDDPNWRELADHLMPNENWQRFRDQNQVPFARGAVFFDSIGEYVIRTVPALATMKSAKYMKKVSTKQIITVICGAGGASLYMIEPKVEGN